MKKQGWRDLEVKNNPWGGLKDKAKRAEKRTQDILRNPINVFQKRKDL